MSNRAAYLVRALYFSLYHESLALHYAGDGVTPANPPRLREIVTSMNILAATFSQLFDPASV